MFASQLAKCREIERKIVYTEIDETEEMRQRNGQTTCYVVAYDIPDNKRRRRYTRYCLALGHGWQYSLFECFLSKRRLLTLQSKLDDYLIEAKDSVRFYPLCANCLEKVETIGGPPPEEALVFVV